MYQLLIPSPRLLAPSTHSLSSSIQLVIFLKTSSRLTNVKILVFQKNLKVASRTSKRRKQRTLKGKQDNSEKISIDMGWKDASVPTNPAQGQVEKTTTNSWKAMSCQKWRWNSKFYSSHPQHEVWFTQSLV